MASTKNKEWSQNDCLDDKEYVDNEEKEEEEGKSAEAILK